MMTFDFSGRVVLVAGATGNLGHAVATAFANAGARLILLDRKSDRLSKLNADLALASEHLLLGSVDANDPTDVEQAVQKGVERFGRIDVLANTVGGYRAGTTVQDTTLETWDFLQNLNARTAFILSRAVVPVMLEQGEGSMVHVAARSALGGGAKASAYSASKTALLRLVESLAAELKHEQVTVNCVLPGTIDTPQNRAAMPNADHSRWVAPQAIADVILFLASDLARSVSGAAIPVYGRS